MEYIEKVRKASTLDELFEIWRKKEPEEICYEDNKKQVTHLINHNSEVFIPDGIIDENVWNNNLYKKKILFVLKEAYGDDWGDLTLATWLKRYHPNDRMWARVARWTYGIQNTNVDRIEKYKTSLEDGLHGECIDQIAIMNLKKSNGKSKSNYDEIRAYADADKEEIKKEFSLIDADIVICGATFDMLLRNVYEIDEKILNRGCDNWYYWFDIEGNGKERLFIDMYHPANRWPDLMNYYTVTSIYQQAIIEKEKQ